MDLLVELNPRQITTYPLMVTSQTRKSVKQTIAAKGIELADGKDVAIIATGALMVDAAVEAEKMLAADGIKATVVDLHTIRPLDTELIEKVALRTGHVLVCENGRYAGGIGEMIAGHLAAVNPVKMGFVNVGERFGEVGNLKYLSSVFGFTADNVAQKAKELLGK